MKQSKTGGHLFPDTWSHATSADLASLLKTLTSSEKRVEYEDINTFINVTGLPHVESVIELAEKEGLVYVAHESVTTVAVIPLTAGRRFLRNWKWRWPRRIGIVVGAASVSLDSLISLCFRMKDVIANAS